LKIYASKFIMDNVLPRVFCTDFVFDRLPVFPVDTVAQATRFSVIGLDTLFGNWAYGNRRRRLDLGRRLCRQ
jgi:hypothetical protein